MSYTAESHRPLVLHVDRHQYMRNNVEEMLAPEFDVISCISAEEVGMLIATFDVDVVVVDSSIRVGEEDGEEFARKLAGGPASYLVIMLCMYPPRDPDIPYIRRIDFCDGKSLCRKIWEISAKRRGSDVS